MSKRAFDGIRAGLEDAQAYLGGDESRAKVVTKLQSPTIARAREFLGNVGEVLRKKNEQYGDSCAQPLRVFSRASAEEQLLVRIDDKLSRIARGVGEDEDVLLDLVGYLAILWAVRHPIGGES